MGKLKEIDKKAEQKGKGLETFWQFIKFIFVSLLAMIVQFTLLNTLKFIPPIHKMFDEAQQSAQIIVSEKDFKIKSVDEMNGLKVGVPEGIIDLLEKNEKAEYVTYATCEEALAAMKDGQVKCVVVNYDTSSEFLKDKENKKVYTKSQIPSEKDFRWLTIFFCAAEIGGLAYFIINNAANIVAQIVSFFVNREKTFNSGANIAVTLPIYIVFTVALLCFSAWLSPTLNDVFMTKLGWNATLALNAATMCCSAIQFFLYFPVDKILFRKKKEEKPAEEEKDD
jgi:putative flippase GtrA